MTETGVEAALAERDLAALERLGKQNIDLNAVRVPTGEGPRTPLEQALRLGDTTLVEGLLALPGVTATGSLPADRFWGWAGRAPLPVLRAFLDRSKVPVGHRDAAGRTVLHAVAAGGADPATVRFLLERMPADQPADDGTTPFFHAAVRGRAEAAGLLLAAGADPNAATKEDGWTALITAVAAGEDVGWLLGTAGLDVNRADRTGTTALHLATALAAHPALDLLLADGRTDRTVRDRWGRTPLMQAAQQGDAATTALLLAGGGRTGENLVDADRATALHHAVLAGSAEVVRALLARPVLNLAITDHGGRTAAQLAQQTGQAAIVELLRAASESAGKQDDRPDGEPPPRPPEPSFGLEEPLAIVEPVRPAGEVRS